MKVQRLVAMALASLLGSIACDQPRWDLRAGKAKVRFLATRERSLLDSRVVTEPAGWRSVRFVFEAFGRVIGVPVVAIALTWLLSVGSLAKPVVGDFASFYYAGVAGSNHANFYEPTILLQTAKANGTDFVYPYLYSPFLAQIFCFFAGRSLSSIYYIWLLLLVGSTATLGVSAAALHSIWIGGKSLVMPLAVTALCILLLPVAHNVAMGQVNLIVLAFILGAMVSYLSGRPALAGALLAPAVFIKGTPVIILGFFCARRSLRAIVGFGAASLFIVALSLEVGGVRPWFNYLSAAQSFGYGSTIPGLFPAATLFNFSAAGYLARLLGSEPELVSPLATTFTAFAFVGACLMAAFAKNRREEILAFAAFSPTMLIASPLSYLHHVVYLAPSALVLLSWSLLQRGAAGFAALLVVLATSGIDWPLFYGGLGFDQPMYQAINLHAAVSVYLIAACAYWMTKRGSTPLASLAS